MVKFYSRGDGLITFKYDRNNENDIKIIQDMTALLDKQPICPNCISFFEAGSFGGYMSCCCEKFGCLEDIGNPHHDMDASKCEFYKRKEDD